VNKDIAQVLQRAAMLINNQQWQEANDLYQLAIVQFPNSHEVYHAFGRLLIAVHKPKIAIEKFVQALRLDPKNPHYHFDLGEMYRRIGMLDRAVKLNRAGIAINSQLEAGHYNLGLSYYDNKQYDEAIDHFKKTIELNPKHGFAWNNLGTTYEKLDNISLAHESYQKAVKLNPQHLEALNNLATTHTQSGNTTEAINIFNNAITIHPYFFEAHFNLSGLKKYTKEDPHVKLLSEVPNHKKEFNVTEAIKYHFAYGKALDDIGEYDKAFQQYNLGNQLQSKLTPYNQAQHNQTVRSTIEMFNSSMLAKHQSSKVTDALDRTPIFIVGMPRSGTSLIEQILDTHPNVYGAGELKKLLESLENNMKQNSSVSILDHMAKADKNFFKKVGDDYMEDVWKLSANSKFISDKMPGNFFNLGLIYLAMPHAKIIHAMRDPMDSCFSNYIRLFKDDMRFAYSQESIADYYKGYHEVMEHWKQVLPPDFICHMKYEDMIANTEQEAKRLCDFIGLEWDPNCLKFYDNKRHVKTASMMQVRQPIYKTSLARWKNFAKHVQPLYDAVKPYREFDFETDNLMNIINFRKNNQIS
jgi:tetratricopeptide (TPR) repeat protein